MTIVIVTTESEFRRCFTVMAQLRTHLAEDQFVAQVQLQQLQGYQLACLGDGDEVLSLAGFRIMDRLSRGKVMYIDDLVTAQDRRSRGYGSRLFDWLVKHAAAQGCIEMHLDSGVQRFAAHRFYCARRMHISAHHFSLNLDEYS